MIDVHGKFDGLGRFAEPSLLILTSLADGPKSGYAIKSDVAGFSGASMAPGTFYGARSWLERRGWVAPLATCERRRPYQITRRRPGPAGRAAQHHAAGRAHRPPAHRYRGRRVMRPALAARLSRALVGCYPRRWRQRYGGNCSTSSISTARARGPCSTWPPASSPPTWTRLTARRSNSAHVRMTFVLGLLVVLPCHTVVMVLCSG